MRGRLDLTFFPKQTARLILRFVFGAVEWAFTLLFLGSLCLRIAALCPLLWRARVIVLQVDMGFGHTITGPDVARRLFPNRRCLVLVLSEHLRHNPWAAAIWPDIRVLFLPLTQCVNLGFISFGLPPRAQGLLKRWVPVVIERLARLGGGRGQTFIRDRQLYRQIPEGPLAELPLEGLYFGFRWPMAYFRLQRTAPAPRVGLPVHLRRGVERRLAESCPGGASKQLCLYLRQKGSEGPGSADVTSRTRVGSPLEDYLPAVRLLNRAGYRALLTGDVELGPAIRREFGGWLVDARSLEIGKGVFDLYAATESAAAICEAGGGLYLPGINGIPTLLLNAFPFGFGMPDSWVYYKTARDRSGELVHYKRLLSDYLYDWELPGLTLHHNSVEEITRAVDRFIADLARGDVADPNAEAMSMIPDHAMIKQAGARISPAWLELFSDQPLEPQDGLRSRRGLDARR